MLAKELLEKEQPDYKVRKKEIHDEIEGQAVELLKDMGLADRMGNIPMSCPADSVSVWRLPVPWPFALIVCALMSRPLHWIRS